VKRLRAACLRDILVSNSSKMLFSRSCYIAFVLPLIKGLASSGYSELY
jgi:hypothetical protein